MSLLPARRDNSAESNARQTAQAVRAQRNTELAIYRYSLDARYRAETDRLDAQAAGDALRASLEEELSLLDYGLQRAAGSSTKAELVSRKLNALAAMNDRRIGRRFGG